MRRTITKATIAGIITMAIFLTACSTMHVVNDTNTEQINLLIIKIAAREFAQELCKRQDCTGNIAMMTNMADLYISQANDGDIQVIDLGKNFMLSLCEDEFLRDDLSDLFDLILASNVSNEELGLDSPETKIFLSRMEYALTGFKQGLKKK